MAHLRIEQRPDGALVLTDTGGARWGMGAVGVGIGALTLAAIATGDVTRLGSVIALPFALIAVLAGLAAARHRDWIVFHRRPGEIVFRRGLAAIFRPVAAVPFGEVEAILVEERSDGTAEVSLRRAGDLVWPIDASPDPAYVGRLVAALEAVGGWSVVHEREAATP